MTIQVDVAVTYVGRDNPFKDRIYRSGLTFTPGQTRLVPETLAARFLRHADVFERAEVKQAAPAPQAPESATQAATPSKPAAQQTSPLEGQQQDSTQTEGQAQQADDTQALLDAAKKQEDTARDQDNARFEMLESIEAMDRNALVHWADVHYKQKIPGNASVTKAREMARGFVDQYGLPA